MTRLLLLAALLGNSSYAFLKCGAHLQSHGFSMVQGTPSTQLAQKLFGLYSTIPNAESYLGPLAEMIGDAGRDEGFSFENEIKNKILIAETALKAPGLSKDDTHLLNMEKNFYQRTLEVYQRPSSKRANADEKAVTASYSIDMLMREMNPHDKKRYFTRVNQEYPAEWSPLLSSVVGNEVFVSHYKSGLKETYITVNGKQIENPNIDPDYHLFLQTLIFHTNRQPAPPFFNLAKAQMEVLAQLNDDGTIKEGYSMQAKKVADLYPRNAELIAWLEKKRKESDQKIEEYKRSGKAMLIFNETFIRTYYNETLALLTMP